MAGYAKLFSDIVHSTVWRESVYTKVVWITMLAMSDRHGLVMASVPGLADASKVDLNQCIEAIKVLSSPDEYSRTKDYEGRRISEVDGGWLLLNYEKFRERKDNEEQRIATAERVRKHRAKEAARSVNVTENVTETVTVTQCNAMKRHTDTDTDTDTSSSSASDASSSSNPKADQDQPQDQDPCEAQKTHLATAKPAKPKKETAPSKTAATWALYSETYRQRYGVDPVRNAKINGQLSQFIARVGEADAPGVVQFYLYHNDGYYIKKGHSLDCLLRDAESLRTQWVTRTQITSIGAKQMERTSHNQNVINQVIRERAERNEQNKQ